MSLSHPKTRSLRGCLVGAAAILAIACSGSSGSDDPNDPNDPKPGDADYFESDNPALGSGDGSGNGGGGEMGAGEDAAAPSGEADDGSNKEAERAIEEADIIQVQGDNLYALSRYGGLSIIDVSTRDQLAVTGRFKSDAMPFEMYVRGDMVFDLFTTWGHYVWVEGENGAQDDWQWVQTSRVVSLDVSNPKNIRIVGEFELPGDISDSRIVGDVLYVVAYENGYCWRCDDNAQTTVVSIDVSKPEAFTQVDRLTFEDANDQWGWSKRSITVNTERMYVAGREYSNDGRGGSTIQVVDISDPAGDMKMGASVEAEGEIRSRWQMSEYEGVLRVISQPPSWNLDLPPVVQTFTVNSSNDVKPLGDLDMILPRAELLQSVRFDGDRAYAITFERTDPLFTIDLSNPATPVQRGELEIPGWVYHMEPRGDRIFALGFDNANDAGSLNVSIFNVEDMDNPTMLDRVNFGGDWSNVGEDQDRIHKAFKILEDQGLILMPFSGWNYTETENGEGYCGGSYVSGVQLIDFTRDDLDLRGVAESYGQARRAFIHDERLFTVSDDRVQTFEFSDRDALAKTASAPLARFVGATAASGDQLLRMGQDWWTDSAQLDVVSIEDANSVSAAGTIDLTSALGGDRCTSSLSSARVYADGDRAYVVYNQWDYSEGGQGLGVAAVDISDPATPTLLSNTDLGFSAGYYWGGYGYDSVMNSGQRSVHMGSTLVFTRFDQEWINNSYVITDAHLQVVDLADPANPNVQRINISNTSGLTGLHVDGTDVLLSHFEAVPNHPGRVRFFIDRIDLSNPSAPRYKGKVNVPGSLFAYDAKNGRAVTVDYRRYRQQMTAEDCYKDHGGYLYWSAEDGSQRWSGGWQAGDIGLCEWVRHTFRLVNLQRTTAALEGSHELAEGAHIGQVAVGDGTAFASINNYYGMYYDCMGCEGYDSKLRSVPVLVLSGLDDGNFVVAQANIKNETPWGGYVQALGAYGSRALLSTGYNGDLVVLNAENRKAPVVEQTIDVAGYVREITIANGVGVVSLGYDGVEMVDLR